MKPIVISEDLKQAPEAVEEAAHPVWKVCKNKASHLCVSNACSNHSKVYIRHKLHTAKSKIYVKFYFLYSLHGNECKYFNEFLMSENACRTTHTDNWSTTGGRVHRHRLVTPSIHILNVVFWIHVLTKCKEEEIDWRRSRRRESYLNSKWTKCRNFRVRSTWTLLRLAGSLYANSGCPGSIAWNGPGSNSGLESKTSAEAS